MSQYYDKLERMLNQATDSGRESFDDLEPEARPLAEAWDALGRLLETAQSDVEPAIGWTAPRSAPRRRWLLPTVAAALAASLLVGVVVTWSLSTKQIAKQPERNDIRLANSQPNHPGEPVVKTPQRTAIVKQVGNQPLGPKWDDSWDEQMTEIGQRVLYAQHDMYAGPDATGSLRLGIEQMQQDFDQSKL